MCAGLLVVGGCTMDRAFVCNIVDTVVESVGKY